MPKLLWLDLETTGLVARRHVILEVALSVADLLDPFKVEPAFHSVAYFPRDRWGELEDERVLEMHTKSGLLDECASQRTPALELVERLLLQHVPEEASKDDKPVLAGSSIHFDHGFLEQHMPRVNARLSHRHYDVSALKLYCQSMGMPKFHKAEAHRAQADVWESITHAKECTTWLQANLRSKQP